MKAEPRVSQAPVQLVIVDDEAIVRDGLVSLFSRRAELQVVGGAAESEGLLDSLTSAPDVALLDIRVNQTGALRDASLWRKRFPTTRLVMLDDSLHESHVRQVIRLKLHGYLLKSDPFREIVGAIETVGMGRYAFSNVIRDRIRIGTDCVTPYLDGTFDGLSTLTIRETEMLVYLAQGLPLTECSQLTNLSLGSIDSYKARIMRKLNARHTIELSRLALAAGLMSYCERSSHPSERKALLPR
jgi:DNA-binding NarL/FixJ family response regulator